MLFEEEKYVVADMMYRFGGSFVKNIGSALFHADRTNALKIKKAFPEYWKQYLGMYDQ